MANYYEYARTNYFRVKDKEAFDAFINKIGGCEIADGEDGRIAVLFTDECVPSNRYDDATKEFVEFDFMDELSTHLADGSVAILTAAGFEKLRYISGYADAINNKGERKSVNIYSIYEMSKSLGSDITVAEY